MKLLLLLAFVGVVAGVAFNSNRGIGCSLCLDFVADLEKELENDEGNIEEKANKICDKLTHNNSILDPLCKAMVDDSLETIVADIKNNEPPKKICQKIHMC